MRRVFCDKIIIIIIFLFAGSKKKNEQRYSTRVRWYNNYSETEFWLPLIFVIFFRFRSPTTITPEIYRDILNYSCGLYAAHIYNAI